MALLFFLVMLGHIVEISLIHFMLFLTLLDLNIFLVVVAVFVALRSMALHARQHGGLWYGMACQGFSELEVFG